MTRREWSSGLLAVLTGGTVLAMGPWSLTQPLLTATPHLARVGCRGELNQAPSLGTAKCLGDISGVERPEEGEAGLSRGSPICLGLWSGISAGPGLILCGSRRLPIPQSCMHLQMPLVSITETQLSFELSKNQNGSRRRELWKCARLATHSRSASGVRLPRTCRWPSCWENTWGAGSLSR